MIEEPVPTMPLMVPAMSPTMRTKRKPKACDLRDSFRREGNASNFQSAPATQLRSLWRVTSLLTPCWQQGPFTNHLTSDRQEGTDHANQGKLPLRPDAIRGQRGAGRRDALHLFAVLKT